MQIPNGAVAEIMGSANYEWVAVDMEHGSIGVAQLPDLFRALELGNTLPMARIAERSSKDCQQALDAGAGGVIIPNIQSADQLLAMRDATRWPPSGKRGVGFSRANRFGGRFRSYVQTAQAPLLVGMLEDARALDELDSILAVEGLDAVLLGPYDLSASLGHTGKFDHKDYLCALKTILRQARAFSIPVGIHVVEPSMPELKQRIRQGFRFLPFSMDSVLLRKSLEQKF
jgi:2-dehydro-3-deoxyglucarate aldolase